MAQYRATIQGNRGMASRLGTKSSGMTARINAWNLGVSVYLTNKDGQDIATVRLTSGSNGGNSKLLGTFTVEDLT